MSLLARSRGRRVGRAQRADATCGVVLAASLAAAGVALALGDPPTTCAHLCPNLPQNCVVSSNVTVVPGSIIDCGTRDVQVTGGDLTVHDGRFELRAGSVTVGGGRKIVADCPQGTGRQGVALTTTGAVTVGTQSRLRADCDAGGGEILIDAGGNVIVGGLGIQAKGTAIDAPGGRIDIRSRGAVTTSGGNATLEANATGTNGHAAGGQVRIEATTVAIGDPVTVSGVGHWSNGSILLRASGDIAVDGTLDASGVTTGDGGDIALESNRGAVTWTRPLRVRGAGNASTGGSVTVSAERISAQGNVVASGGTDGGGIVLEARGDALVVGTASAGPELDVNGDHGGTGGEIKLVSAGSSVTIYGNVHGTDELSGGHGATVEVAGVSVTAHAGSVLNADGASGKGGTIRIEARETMTLSGTLHANNGMATFAYRTTPPSIGGGVSGPTTQESDASLPAPCGDGVRRQGVEQCDGSDLGIDANGEQKTCQSLGYASGDLWCLETCLYDTSRCS